MFFSFPFNLAFEALIKLRRHEEPPQLEAYGGGEGWW